MFTILVTDVHFLRKFKKEKTIENILMYTYLYLIVVKA